MKEENENFSEWEPNTQMKALNGVQFTLSWQPCSNTKAVCLGRNREPERDISK